MATRSATKLTLTAILVPAAAWAQLTTGAIEGTLRALDGSPAAAATLIITGATGFHTAIHPDSNGEFAIALPYGRYRLSGNAQPGAAPSGVTIFVAPLQTARLDLVIGPSGEIGGVQAPRTLGIWTDASSGYLYPEAFSLPGILLSREPSSVTEPLDFTGLGDNRLAVESQRGFSWTDTQYKLLGMDATDSYQPGLPAILPDVESLDEVVVRSAFAQIASTSYGSEIGLFLAEPGASLPGHAWHGAVSTNDTGAAFASTNLPAPESRGLVQQPSQFLWFTRDRSEIGGPVAKWADIYASASGQWAAQTEPLSSPGADQRSRLLFGNVRGRVRAGAKDRFDALYSGSRIDLSDGGVPAGIEALMGNRMAPSFVLPGGFSGDPETDHFDFVQVGWTHLLEASSGAGAIEVRYGSSTAHVDTGTSVNGQSVIELLGGQITGAPPLANLGIRPRHGLDAAWQPAVLRALGVRHRIVAGGGWERSEPQNRFSTPSGMNLIAADGAPAFVEEFNTPLNSRELIQSFSIYATDQISLTSSLSLDLGALADFSRGSLPAQSSPAGAFAPVRIFTPQSDLIVWNNLSPRAGMAWQVPHTRGLILRGAYFRLYSPLAGRYLDFGNPNSLGGNAYQWLASNPNAPFQADQQGNLLFRFGGPYSSISPSLGRPYANEFDLGAQFPFAPRSTASIHLFRRDDKDRLAAIDTGVPAQAFTPVTISDPASQPLTVYAQNPATLGQDRYLLTNPAGLSMLDTGLVAEAGTEWRDLTLHASFTAEKSYGPTNPGDSVYENDPGVIGSLFLDPNYSINAAGNSFVDRAHVGKIQATYQLPQAWGGVEISSVADYVDGLPFARELLVTSLPQGPFLVGTTPRGSVDGGNRSQYVANWNLRFSRQFPAPAGRLTAAADIFNVTNAAQRLQENDLSGPSFNLRLPAAIQAPRSVRIGIRYEF